MGLLTSKTILITGGTGSFGQRAVVRFLDEGASRVIIYSRDEYKQSVMAGRFDGDSRVVFWLGDVRDEQRLTEVCEGVDYVIHAAALKQVPSCEENPMEAVLTNVVGAHNLTQAARHHGVDKVVNLSADKAVYSTSVYGATKSLAERLFVQANRQEGTRFVNLRYSNVLDSRGGVFEVFRQKLERGAAVAVFDPRMTRFFLTQGQVVDLCLFALEHAVGGETLVKLAAPVNVLNLAQGMCKVIGKGSTQVLENQARPGDKLDAVLLSGAESRLASLFGDIIIINNLGRPMALEPLLPLPEKDHTVDDYEPMSAQELESLIAETLGAA